MSPQKTLAIITDPDPILHRRAEAVPVKDIPSLQSYFDHMAKTMIAKDGIGLAAPQVNDSRRIIIINTKDGHLVLVNPVLKKKSFSKESAEEGCLSLPGLYAVVKRHVTVTVHALSRTGEKISIDAKGMMARVLQHEIDHIDGILITDRSKEVYRQDTSGNHEPV